jgi:hypothetical protein
MILIAAEYASVKLHVIDSDINVARLDLGPGKSLNSTPAILSYLASKQSKEKVK